jgi:hypothetical protein
VSTYSTRVLAGVRRSLKLDSTFLLGRYFNNVVLSDAEEVTFDQELHDEKLAPFVAPQETGEIMLEQGFQSETISPAYIKIKTPLAPFKSIKRAMGEDFNGKLSRKARMDMRLAETMRRHEKRINRRLEAMAAQILVTGQLVLEGLKYPRRIVNFGRNAALNVPLVGADRWNQAGSNPIRDMERWSHLVLQASGGAVVTEWVMDPDAWAACRENERVLKLLDQRRAGPEIGADRLDLGPRRPVAQGASYVGSLGQFDIYVYAAFYRDANNNVVPYLPSGTVIGMGADFEGVQYFGAIEDVDVLVPMKIHQKTDTVFDPSQLVLMSQTAPLLAPGRKDAQVTATVL